MELSDILQCEKQRAGFQIRDAVKLIYQNEFGGGHLISDPDLALERLRQEINGCDPSGMPLFTDIGNGVCRVDLSSAAGRISAETLFRIFYLSSREKRGDVDSFKAKLGLVYELGFDRGEVDEFLTEYATAGFSSLSHSDTYRAANRPAYRVILAGYARFFDVFSAVDRLSRFSGPIIIGIDGMCAAGKSTLGKMLAEVYDANLFHADDYFLPADMRTPERLAQPGGNLHRERLAEEVLLPLARGEKAVTRRFDCGEMALEPPVEHALRRVNIVEGSYCLHPELREAYTLKIALRTAPETQIERLRGRDPERERAYVEKWIPLENSYFDFTGLFEAADKVIRT